MQTFTFNSIEDLNTVLDQLPADVRSMEGELMAVPGDDGTYTLIVSDDVAPYVSSASTDWINTDALKAEADKERDTRLDAGIMFGGKKFQTDPASRERIAGATQMSTTAILIDQVSTGNLRWAVPDTDFAWIAENNERVPMDAQTMNAFGNAVGSRHTSIMLFARTVKDQIDVGGITTVEQVQAAFEQAVI